MTANKPQYIHIFGQPKPTKVSHPLTVQDMRSVAFFNRIIKNYLKMNKIQKRKE